MIKVFIFDLQNSQKEYAVALKFIKTLEDRHRMTEDAREKVLLEMKRKIKICAGELEKDISPRYYEQPMNVSERGSNLGKSVRNKHEPGTSDFADLSQYRNIRYYVRVHFGQDHDLETLDESELIHLQYLAMFLKQADMYFKKSKNTEEYREDELKKYLTVFLIPVTANGYPFKNVKGDIDYSVYAYASRYLRLLSKRYTGVIYGVNESPAGRPVVTSLDFRRNKKCKSYFPLIIINENIYETLFGVSVTEILDTLFALKSNGRFRNSRDEDPEYALQDFIAETDLYRIRDAVLPDCYSGILKFLKSKTTVSLMEFSLFAFMLSMDTEGENDNPVRRYVNIWELAHEISQALKQVVQNAIQHTENQECFFSFYLHEKDSSESMNSFIQKMSRSYPNTYFDEMHPKALEIFISDLNDREDMLDNFIGNLKYEYGESAGEDELSAHLKLTECQDRLAIRNFFSVYKPKDARKEWIDFRQEDLAAHIGLSQFAQTAGKCKASVRVVSSKCSELKDSKRYFYQVYGKNKTGKIQEEWKDTWVIPGTQFAILIPVWPWKDHLSMGIGQLKQKNCATENYASFAAFLDYYEKRICISQKDNSVSEQQTQILNAKRKYHLVQNWKKYWENKFEDNIRVIREGKDGGRPDAGKTVFNYDFYEVSDGTYFNNGDRIEVFLKGMISALNIAGNQEDYFLIALTNLPEGFLEVFRKVCVQLSVRQFPENVQIYLQERENKNKRIIMLGKDFSQAIGNSYVLSIGHGVEGFDKNECENALEIKTTLMAGMAVGEGAGGQKMTGVCPFDVILSCSGKDKRSYFEIQLKEMAEGSLDEELIGYKLNNTHMRLGSKVHIDSFYEMSFLFYRTTIANRLAFHLLRQMKKRTGKVGEEKIDLIKDTILFYGYASYSKALLTSANEILRQYRILYSEKLRNNESLYKESLLLKDKTAYVSFQHNLMLESEETQMYYDLPLKNFPGSVDEENRLHLKEKIRVIQIVPISSTLTTFDKMWKRFLVSVVDEEKDKICLAGNYTIFWVVDKAGSLDEGLPSEIEKKYWEKVLPGHIIRTKLPALACAGNRDIEYQVRSAVVWNDPLKCRLCYPEYVIHEVPLVETDPTSTVPTQQIRYKKSGTAKGKKEAEKHYDRFQKLQNCVLYDHIGRRQNHYQFYIDTQQYFYNAKDMVKDWLSGCGSGLQDESSEPTLHIIFSPEHNTNVGFVQYVNTYYFQGLAEIVSINVDKQFRSNFICEHAALKRMIEELHRDRCDMDAMPVKFYFVDDTVITGDTLEKANGLLHSLVPADEYPVNLFSKIFVLMDRLSDDTKQMYVDHPERNFLAFIHIDISNVRTHGDSCIGCKLEQDAMKLYKRSATRNMASYWYRKLYDYRKKAYDNKKEIAEIGKEKSYRMLLFSHVLQNVIVKQENCYHLGDAFDIVLNISLGLLRKENKTENDLYGYFDFLEDFRNMTGFCTLLKTICRPFFSYDFKIKRQLYTFFICLTEMILGEKRSDIVPEESEENKHISYLIENGRLSKMEILAEGIKQELSEKGSNELEFLKDYLLEGLTDMGSTYAMRLQTLKKVYAYVENEKKGFPEKEKNEFWNSYEVNIHRLVTGNADESRELWLEYMYLTGMEYSEFEKSSGNDKASYEPGFFYQVITGKNLSEPGEKYFYLFCHNLFLQNTGICFDELENQMDDPQNPVFPEGGFLKDYWRQMRRLDSFENPLFCKGKNEKWNMESERKLFDLLKSKDAIKTKQSVNQWYELFLNYIVGVIREKYKIEEKDINITMLTESKGGRECAEHIQRLDIVKESINPGKSGISETRYFIKERIADALNNKGLFSLEENGYTISEGDLKGGHRPYVVAFFDNPGKNDAAEDERSLARVFLYISIPQGVDKNKTQLQLRLILRDVMMYRNRILRFLEKDFAGEIYASYAHTIGEKNILSNEKAHSHNTTADDEISLEIFQKEKIFGRDSDYKILCAEDAAKWLLLRNYTNGQIAKIFNRSFHDTNEGADKTIKSPMLYIPQDSSNYGNKLFKRKLEFFSNFNIKNENQEAADERFQLLNEIIDIQYEEELNHAAFIQGDAGQYYNLEYFKCILIDIMISAIKFECDRSDYLTRIDRLLDVKHKLENDVPKWNREEKEIADVADMLEQSRCSIEFLRRQSPILGIDYLVIKNPVTVLGNKLKNWEEQNKIILHRLEDPLDYADGHMSLLAIKRYVENLDKTKRLECVFEYIMSKDKKLYFENRLPVLKGENNETIILD